MYKRIRDLQNKQVREAHHIIDFRFAEYQ